MACFFHSPTIVGWMPCFVANWAVVSSPRSASSATFALNSAEYRFRLLVIQVRPSQERTELKPLSEFAAPPHAADAPLEALGQNGGQGAGITFDHRHTLETIAQMRRHVGVDFHQHQPFRRQSRLQERLRHDAGPGAE